MRIYAKHNKTGPRFTRKGHSSFTGQAPNLDEETIKSCFNSSKKTEEDLLEWIKKSTNIPSSDIRRCLEEICKMTFWAGNIVVRIGQKILDILNFIMSEFPKASLLAVVGFFLGILIGIPVLGFLLASVGGIIGVREDLEDKKLKRLIKKETTKFDQLKTS